MKLTVEINLDNDEFAAQPAAVCKRLLTEVNQWLYGLPRIHGREAQKILQDVNGNTVGKACLTKED